MDGICFNARQKIYPLANLSSAMLSNKRKTARRHGRGHSGRPDRGADPTGGYLRSAACGGARRRDAEEPVRATIGRGSITPGYGAAHRARAHAKTLRRGRECDGRGVHDCASSGGPEWQSITEALKGDPEMDKVQQELLDSYVDIHRDALAPFSAMRPAELRLAAAESSAPAMPFAREMSRGRTTKARAVDALPRAGRGAARPKYNWTLASSPRPAQALGMQSGHRPQDRRPRDQNSVQQSRSLLLRARLMRTAQPSGTGR